MLYTNTTMVFCWTRILVNVSVNVQQHSLCTLVAVTLSVQSARIQRNVTQQQTMLVKLSPHNNLGNKSVLNEELSIVVITKDQTLATVQPSP